MTPDSASAGYFNFAAHVRPIPEAPTHCADCHIELEPPTRRYAGLCARCVRARARPSAARSERPHFELLRVFVRRDRCGRQRHFVEARCSCGHRRTLRLSTWELQRPQCCNRCRLAAIEKFGIEVAFGL